MHGFKRLAARNLVGLALGLLSPTSFAAAPGAETKAPGGASAITPYVEVPIAGVGYIGGYRQPGDTDPENTPATIGTSSTSYGWDYRNRSLVIDLGLRKTVNRIILLDNVIDNHGTASNLNKNSIRIYSSDDNKRYVRYSRDYDLSVNRGDGLTNDGKAVFDILEFDRLAIRARYIKLNTTYGGGSSNFACANLQTGIKVFQLKSESFEIRDIWPENRILAWGENRIYLDLTVPEGRRACLVLALADGTQLRNEQKRAVHSSGKQALAYTVGALEPGAYELICRLQSERGTVEAEKGLPLKLFSRRIRTNKTPPTVVGESRQADMERPAAGEILLIDDFKEILAHAQVGFADYKSTRTGTRKTMALLKPGIAPATVCLPARGWCAIYVGLHNTGGGITLQLEDEKETKTCLPGKDPYAEIGRVTGKASSTPRGEGDSITDVFVKYADLKGQNAIITPNDQRQIAGLAYLKILCLTPRQVELVKGQRDISLGKHYIYTQDGYQNWNKCNVLKDVGKFSGHPEVEAYCWGIGGSAMYYPTRIGTLLGEQRVFPRKLDKAYVDSLHDLVRAGQSPIGMAVQHARRIGTKVYALYRMNAEYGQPYDKLFNSRFWHEHPQYRVVTSQDGLTSSNLSYAFPEVRKYKLDILREAVETYDVEGVHLELLRNPPFFGYELPLVDGFQKEYGLNVLSPDFKANATWYKYRARFMTDFLRELRSTLDQVGRKRGRRLWLGARVDWSEYLRQGLDVETWIKEGLVDMLAAGVNGLGYPYAPADEFVRMAKGTKCRIYGSTSPEGAGYRDPTPEDDKTGHRFYPRSAPASLDMRRRRYLEYFKRGVQGMYLFNDGGSYLGEFSNLERWGEFEDPLGFHVEPIELVLPR